MPKQNETKHEAFLRLADARMAKTLDEIRLVGQLSARSYENTPEEALTIVEHLSRAVAEVSKLFEVPFSVAIGDDAQRAAETGHLVTGSKAGPINEMDVAVAIQKIQNGDSDEAIKLLKSALTR